MADVGGSWGISDLAGIKGGEVSLGSADQENVVVSCLLSVEGGSSECG